MYEELFKTIGLNENEAEIYEILLNLGPVPVREILKKTALQRSNLYNVLNSLKAKGLVGEKIGKAGLTIFYPETPDKLEDLVTASKKRLAQSKSQFEANLAALKSLFFLSQERPVIRFYEGKAGVEKVAADSLTSKTEILSYLDPEAIDKYIGDLNLEYKRQRVEKEIFKKILVADTSFNRRRYAKIDIAITAVRYMDEKITPFQTIMQIYNNKISYITLTEKKMIGVIIEDQNIYQMHKAIFEYNWRLGKE